MNIYRNEFRGTKSIKAEVGSKGRTRSPAQRASENIRNCTLNSLPSVKRKLSELVQVMVCPGGGGFPLPADFRGAPSSQCPEPRLCHVSTTKKSKTYGNMKSCQGTSSAPFVPYPTIYRFEKCCKPNISEISQQNKLP